MTSRERFLAALRGGQTDRFFRYEHGPWPSTRERWIAEGYPAGADFAAHFGMDPLIRIGINSGYTDSPFEPGFSEATLGVEDGCRVFVGRDGIVRRELGERSDTSMPQFLRFPVASRADWREVRRRLDPAAASARIGDVAALAARCAREPGTPTMLPICGAYGHPRNLFGEEGMAYVLYDDPALLSEVLDNWRDLYVELIRRLAERVRVDVLLVWEDMCYRNGPLIGPDHFRRFLLPRYREVIGEARAAGVQAVLVDTDGDCWKLIPLFLECGADALMPFEVQAGMDVREVGDRFPGLGIMGGIDKRALAEGPDAIRREVDRIVPSFRTRGGFIPTLDHTVPPNVPLSAFECYLACVRERGG